MNGLPDFDDSIQFQAFNHWLIKFDSLDWGPENKLQNNDPQNQLFFRENIWGDDAMKSQELKNNWKINKINKSFIQFELRIWTLIIPFNSDN